MRYYKIVQNGLVIGAGTMFLRWYPQQQRFMYCDIEEAELAQDVITETLYHADWLRTVPEGAYDNAPEAQVMMIDATEYDEIIALLDGGEEIPVGPEPEPEPEPQPEPEPEPVERPMTVQEMREKIGELTSMTAKDNIPKGSYFVLHDEVYLAWYAIEKGAEIRPGRNCIKKSLDDIKEGD